MPFALAGRDPGGELVQLLVYPIFCDDDDQIAGIFCVAQETTDKVLAERRAGAERERLTRMFDQAPSFVALLEGPDIGSNSPTPLISGWSATAMSSDKTVAEALPDAAAQGYLALLDEVYRIGNAYSRWRRIRGADDAGGPTVERHVDFVYQPMTEATGVVTGHLRPGRDVTERVIAEIHRLALSNWVKPIRDIDDPDDLA